MRLREIEAARNKFAGLKQETVPRDISDEMTDVFHLRRREPLRRKLLRRVAPVALAVQQPAIHRKLEPTSLLQTAILSVGERFAFDASLSKLLSILKGRNVSRVLIPGCFLGSDDVQFWARRGVPEIHGIDVYSLDKAWRQASASFTANYASKIEFRQASIEDMPFAEATFDLICSSAVLEHVRNMSSTVDETARVLRGGGLAWHQFGPLYFTHGGDHCISAYGFDSGYNHLLLDDDEYVSRVNNEAFFNATDDRNMAFWARKDQFSFLRIDEYIQAFERHFRVEHLILKISPEGLAYRERRPESWRKLLDAGVREVDLLAKSACVILSKR